MKVKKTTRFVCGEFDSSLLLLKLKYILLCFNKVILATYVRIKMSDFKTSASVTVIGRVGSSQKTLDFTVSHQKGQVSNQHDNNVRFMH